MSEMSDILAERGANYGDFSEQAALSQKLKELVITSIVTRGVKLEPYMAESLELICMKLSRLGTGDVFHEDSWRDIAGYAELSADRVKIANSSQKLAQLIDSGVFDPSDAREGLRNDQGHPDRPKYGCDGSEPKEKTGESSLDDSE